jgi:hypothetical protein
MRIVDKQGTYLHRRSAGSCNAENRASIEKLLKRRNEDCIAVIELNRQLSRARKSSGRDSQITCIACHLMDQLNSRTNVESRGNAFVKARLQHQKSYNRLARPGVHFDDCVPFFPSGIPRAKNVLLHVPQVGKSVMRNKVSEKLSGLGWRFCLLVAHQLAKIDHCTPGGTGELWSRLNPSLCACSSAMPIPASRRELGQQVSVVLACRTYDLQNDPQIKNWLQAEKQQPDIRGVADVNSVV